MKLNKTVSEFKEFIAQGNVMDMAVGVIIGGAFGKIVTSLVNDILMPIVGVLLVDWILPVSKFKLEQQQLNMEILSRMLWIS